MVRSRAYRTISGAWDQPVVLACSGGVDSTALLVLACEALTRRKVAPFVVVHVDHRTRPDSASDADVVRAHCHRFGVPFVARTVLKSEVEPGRSPEDQWRERRYRELSHVSNALGIQTIVTAHTQEDQVETVLMRVFSGSAPAGMRVESRYGAAEMTLSLLRPLLGTSRRELYDVLENAPISPLIDPSNDDTAYRRNAVRHEIVPALRRVFPGFGTALLRSVELVDRDAQYCDRVAEAEYGRLRKPFAKGIRIDRLAVRQMDHAISSRIVRLAATELAVDSDMRELSFERIDAVLQAVNGRTGALIELPYGIAVEIERDAIVMSRNTKGVAVD